MPDPGASLCLWELLRFLLRLQRGREAGASLSPRGAFSSFSAFLSTLLAASRPKGRRREKRGALPTSPRSFSRSLSAAKEKEEDTQQPCSRCRRWPPLPGTMPPGKVWLLAWLLLYWLPFPGLETVKVHKRPMRTRTCADRPEELLEQLYGRLSAGMLSAFHHTLQLEPLEKEHNMSCPAGGRPATDKKYRLPINLNSVSPWSYRISYDPTRYPKYIPEAYCLCKGCLTGVYGEENLHFRSTPVFMPTVILRRTASCTGGRYVYSEDYVTIPVGCTCVPESEKEAERVNSSINKQAIKLLANHNSDKPPSE
uniref:Interleukin 17D n=1 Tax=Anolis carolinensis TaxID=28377 RepID=A0A803T2E5_ANOCA|nr:PREDICTED: interleukin-17D [Anolis carolinensis]|eukprot:XP_003219315.1 PREDICTED: interleukin-17D [Anolis carolinensis]